MSTTTSTTQSTTNTASMSTTNVASTTRSTTNTQSATTTNVASSTLSTTNVGTYTRSTTNTGSTTTTSTQTTTSVTTWPWPYFASNSTAAQTSYEVGYWNLDEATPNTDYNDLWKNHDGTGTGMSTATSYWTGRSAKFQSAQGNPATSYISMGAGTIEAPLKSTTGFTVSLSDLPRLPQRAADRSQLRRYDDRRWNDHFNQRGLPSVDFPAREFQ